MPSETKQMVSETIGSQIVDSRSVDAESLMRYRVLPLHLNAAELLMLAQDLPGLPSTFVVQLEFRGQIDRRSFEVAIAEALDRHPLLRAVIQPGKGGMPCWTAATDQRPLLDWAVDSVPMNCPAGEAIDLSREIGLRIWVRQGAERALVLLQFHHACSDGTGAYRFIGDLLACYTAQTDSTGTAPPLAPVRLPLLRRRADRLLGAPFSPRTSWPAGLAESCRILVNRPLPLTLPMGRRANDCTDRFPGFLSMSLDRTEHQCLRKAAGERGASLNDLLLRDLFLALNDWNKQQGLRRRAQPLRIMMPVDLRDVEDREMPAANLTSYAFLNRNARKWGSPDELLMSIRAETELFKSHQSGQRFMHIIDRALRRRWLLPFILSRNICLATAVLSNAADPSRRFTATFSRQSGRIVCGNLVLDAITGVPPLRLKTRATFSISQYNRQLAVSLRCDPHYFCLEDTAMLLHTYMRRLRQSACLDGRNSQ
jgi:hypothetical protein